MSKPFASFIVLSSIILLFPWDATGQMIFDQRNDVVVTDNNSPFSLPWVGGINSAQYNTADLDGDGSPELIVYDRSADRMLIFQYHSGTYRPANALRYLLPQFPAGWVLFADYNKDGKKDIFSNGTRGVIVYKNIATAGQPADWEKVADPLLTTGFSGKINLIVNASDVPAISDIDGDGDLDILVYNFAIGGKIRYNKNLSMELYGIADSLEFEIKTRSWGEFEECNCNQFAFNGQTCADLSNGRVQHAGGKALLAYDADGDGDKDLLAGHEQCDELYFYENMGDADSAYMTGFSNMFPDSLHPANFHLFPAAYLVDVDRDGLHDLLVSTGFGENIDNKIDFNQSSWWYKNTGTEQVPAFTFQQKDFLQHQMIDLGENADPVVADLNADGKEDLLVAANGYWNGQNFSGHVAVLHNTGSLKNPSFSMDDSDFLKLSSLNLTYPNISLIDMNGDDAPDLIYSGLSLTDGLRAFLIPNTAPVGQPVSFDINQRQPLSLPNAAISADKPYYFDVDQDGHPDLLLARQNGALQYYKNKDDLNFELVDPAYLGIELDFSLIRGNLSVSIGDLDGDGLADLVATDRRGTPRVYFDFIHQQEGSYTFVDILQKNPVSGIDEAVKIDQNPWTTCGDLFDNGTASIVAGGSRGGLQLFQNLQLAIPETNKKPLQITIYPNPSRANNLIAIRTSQDASITLHTLLGQQLIGPFDTKKFVEKFLATAFLPNGTYLIHAKAATGATSSKLFIVHR